MKNRIRVRSACALHVEVFESEDNENASPISPHEPSEEDTDDTTQENYATKLILGRGGLGSVFHVECLHTPKTFFAKKTVMLTSAENKLRVQRECSILQKLTGALDSKENKSRRPPTVRLHDIIYYPNCTSLVLTYAPIGDLGSYLQYKPAVPLSTMLFFATELIVALEFLHYNQILHRDIKPENILLDQRKHLLLTDFDLSLDISELTEEITSRCGTFEYMAPEVADQSVAYSYPADIFSLGLTLLSTVSEGGDTFRCSNPTGNLTRDELESLALRGRYQLAKTVSRDSGCRHLFQRMLMCNAAKRTGLVELKAEPVFSTVNWTQVERGDNKVPHF